MGFRRLIRDLNDCLADYARLPANARPDEQGVAVVPQLHDLGEIGAEGLRHEPRGFGQDFIQVLGPEGKLPEAGQNGLLVKKLPLVVVFHQGISFDESYFPTLRGTRCSNWSVHE